MAAIERGMVLRQVERLFGHGTIAGLTDAELLERFVARRDEAAFAALVQRHGPMVLATCRRVLRDPHDAEDAFQAVFLVLVRKADSIHGCAALGGWLHRVAVRIAVQANDDAARRRVQERRAGALAAARTMPEGADDDLWGVIHAEIDRLPERYRLPLVLCHLEGLTREETARRLHWSNGEVRGRLAKRDSSFARGSSSVEWGAPRSRWAADWRVRHPRRCRPTGSRGRFGGRGAMHRSRWPHGRSGRWPRSS